LKTNVYFKTGVSLYGITKHTIFCVKGIKRFVRNIKDKKYKKNKKYKSKIVVFLST